MSMYVTDIYIVTKENVYPATSGQLIPVNLNKGTTAPEVFLWYSKSSAGRPVTRIQFSFSEDTSRNLKKNNYKMIPLDLNYGTDGNQIHMWYLKGSTKYDIPIVDLFVACEPQEEAQLFQMGWERLACNLNRGASGSKTFLWVKWAKPTWVCDITAISNYRGEEQHFREGFFRIDEDANRGTDGGNVFVFYRKSADISNAIQDIKISNSNKGIDGYTIVEQDLNQGCGGESVYLFYKKKANGKPIISVTLVTGDTSVNPYKRAGAQVIESDLNTTAEGAKEYLCFCK